jgi:hypothetical protein
MVRLPVTGGDNGTWGDILNSFLLTSHESDGSLKSSAIPDRPATSITFTPAGTISSTTVQSSLEEIDTDVSVHATDTQAHGATGAVVGTTNAQNLTNKTITDSTNNIAANSLVTNSGLVSVDAAAAPSSGQYLRAGNGTTASWQSMPRTFGWYLDGAVAVSDAQGPIYRIDANVTILAFDLHCKVAPTGSGAEFDVEFSTTPNGVFTSIFSVKPTIAVGTFIGTGGTLSTTTLSAGEYVRFNADTVGSGSAVEGVMAQLRMETR